MMVALRCQRGWRLSVLIAIVSGIFLGSGPADGQLLPQDAKDLHLGVTSCKSSGCHGSVTPLKATNIPQNEFIIWQLQDPHSKAYTVLRNERSKRIAANLGLKDAHTAKQCLDCHSDNVGPKQRGKQFQLSDGVSCEACHGGAFRWIAAHLAQQGHAFNVANGMYPTTDPVKRAELCLSCHFGNEDKFVTHQMMGAGHPRLLFELDTFTWVQPAHFEIDADYRQRKTVTNGAKTWAVGQAMAIARTLDSLMNPKINKKHGTFPELVFYDCHACHHRLIDLRWQPREGTKLKPGLVRLNDSNLVMLRVIMRHLDKEQGDRLADQTVALHIASTQGPEATAKAVKDLRRTVQNALALLVSKELGVKDMRNLLEGMVNEGLRGELVDRAAAEQAIMALNSMVEAIKVASGIEQSQYKSLKSALDGAYELFPKENEKKKKVLGGKEKAAVEKVNVYDPNNFVAFLREFQDALKIKK